MLLNVTWYCAITGGVGSQHNRVVRFFAEEQCDGTLKRPPAPSDISLL